MPKASRIRIRWARGGESLNVDAPLTVFSLGVRGGGKSAFLEALGEHYLAKGHDILDLFGASSGEGLAWLRSPWVREMKLPVLLIRGNRPVSYGKDGQEVFSVNEIDASSRNCWKNASPQELL